MKNIIFKNKRFIGFLIALFLVPIATFASGVSSNPEIFGIRIEFIMFALVLISVAVFHNQTFWVALGGLTVILTYKIGFDPNFHLMEHLFGSDHSFIDQIVHKEMRQGEWAILLNLLGLLLGFALLAKIFEESGVSESMTKYLPNDWKAPLILLLFVMFISSFLDNIAAAMIGGAIAIVVFNKKVHIGYIVAIVAASNAGGAGSIVGDTTTTMMWIDGVSAFNVLHAFIASVVAVAFFGWFAAHQQHKFQPIQKQFNKSHSITWQNIALVVLILVGAILGNIYFDMPAFGVWVAIVIGIAFSKIPWGEIPKAIQGTIFLLCLVSSASLMPVETLPEASWVSAFVLGFVSAVFDNIPLTKLCLEQGHFDWGMLAYSVGFGGSMIWFGSSAGVAITNEFPEARNVVLWIKNGWHVIVGYVLGFFALLLVLGWNPASNKKHAEPAINCTAKDCPVAEKAKMEVKP